MRKMASRLNGAICYVLGTANDYLYISHPQYNSQREDKIIAINTQFYLLFIYHNRQYYLTEVIMI